MSHHPRTNVWTQEECDDGGLDAFDGCDANCKARSGEWMMFDVKMVLGCLISYYPCTSMVYLIHLHTFTYIYIHLHTFTYMCIYIYIHLHTFAYIYPHVPSFAARITRKNRWLCWFIWKLWYSSIFLVDKILIFPTAFPMAAGRAWLRLQRRNRDGAVPVGHLGTCHEGFYHGRIGWTFWELSIKSGSFWHVLTVVFLHISWAANQNLGFDIFLLACQMTCFNAKNMGYDWYDGLETIRNPVGRIRFSWSLVIATWFGSHRSILDYSRQYFGEEWWSFLADAEASQNFDCMKRWNPELTQDGIYSSEFTLPKTLTYI